MRYTTLDNFIRNLAAFVDDPEAKRTYTKFLRITLEELESLNLTTIPDVKSKIFTVDENNIITLPADAINPVKAGKYVDISGVAGVYPLGKKGAGYELAIKPNNGFSCEPNNITNTKVVFSYENHNSNEVLNLFYINSFYGEDYSYREDRVFGYWTYDKEWNRMIFEDGTIQPGDSVVVQYSVYNDDFKLIPLEVKPMLRHKVLYWFYSNSNRIKAEMHFRKFKMEYARYKRNRKGGYSYDDYINALQKGYYGSVK